MRLKYEDCTVKKSYVIFLSMQMENGACSKVTGYLFWALCLKILWLLIL